MTTRTPTCDRTSRAGALPTVPSRWRSASRSQVSTWANCRQQWSGSAKVIRLARIGRRGVESRERLGKHTRVVERAIPWLPRSPASVSDARERFPPRPRPIGGRPHVDGPVVDH